MSISIQSIANDDTHLHGARVCTESYSAGALNAAIHWTQYHPRDPLLVAAQDAKREDSLPSSKWVKNKRTYHQLLQEIKCTSKLVDGCYVRTIGLKPPGTQSTKYGHLARAVPTEEGYASMWGVLRGLVAEGYTDFDLSRAHPTFLVVAAEGLDVPVLTDLVKNHGTHEADLIEKTKCTADFAKRLLTRAVNGGGYAAWRKDAKVPMHVAPPVWWAGLQADLETVWGAMDHKCPHIKRAYERKKAKVTTAASSKKWVGLNLLMNNRERLAMEELYKHYTEDERQRIIYCSDGVMVPDDIAAARNVEWMNALCVPDSALFGMTWMKKPFKQDLMHLRPAPHDPTTADVATAKRLANLPQDRFCIKACIKYCETYEERRTYFQRFYALMLDQGQVISTEHRTSLMCVYEPATRSFPIKDLLTHANFMTLAKDVDNDSKRGSARQTFLNEYLKYDYERTTYDKALWMPYNGVAGPERHAELPGGHTFNVFPGYSLNIHTDPDDITPADHEAFAQFLDILTQCVGGETNLAVYTQLLATAILDPQRKLNYAIIHKSRAGEGKDTTIDAVSNVIGSELVLRMQQMDGLAKLGGTGRIAEKLIIQINEAAKGQATDMEGAIKSLTVDEFIEIRKLYQNPEMARIFALWIFCSNKLQVVAIDTDSGERRFFVFEGTGKYATISDDALPQETWAAVRNGIKTPGFVRLLYDYLTRVYDKDYDFAQAKYENTQTEAYKRMMTSQNRDEVTWLCDFVEANSTRDLLAQANAGMTAEKDHAVHNADTSPRVDGQAFYEDPAWNTKVRVQLKDLHSSFKTWAGVRSLTNASRRTLTTFESNLISVLALGFRVVPTTTTGITVLEYSPCDVYYNLYTKYMSDPKLEVIPQLNQMKRVRQKLPHVPVPEPDGWLGDESESDAE